MGAFRFLVLVTAVLSPAMADTQSVALDPTTGRVTASFQKADLEHVLFYLFLETKLRYEAPKDTHVSITASVSDVPFDRALQILLEPYGFTFRREDDLYRIVPKEEFLRVGEQLIQERKNRERQFWIWMSRRPPKREPRREVRFLDDWANNNAAGSMPLMLPRRAPAGNRPAGQSIQLGPLSIPIPDSLRLLPGGGWALSLPGSTETTVGGTAGAYTLPMPAPNVLTIVHAPTRR